MLGTLLPDAIHLRLAAKQAHWNVRGPNFIGLHELFDKVADAADEATDLIAERLVQVDQYAGGTLGQTARGIRLAPYPESSLPEKGHVRAITVMLEGFSELCQRGIEQTDRAGDACTADILTQVAREMDKLAWMVGSHLDG